jgi:hypothetical protein
MHQQAASEFTPVLRVHKHQQILVVIPGHDVTQWSLELHPLSGADRRGQVVVHPAAARRMVVASAWTASVKCTTNSEFPHLQSDLHPIGLQLSGIAIAPDNIERGFRAGT